MPGEFIFSPTCNREKTQPSEMKKSETDNGVIFSTSSFFITCPRELGACIDVVCRQADKKRKERL